MLIGVAAFLSSDMVLVPFDSLHVGVLWIVNLDLSFVEGRVDATPYSVWEIALMQCVLSS